MNLSQHNLIFPKKNEKKKGDKRERCEKVKDISIQAGKRKGVLKDKLWKEKQRHGVC